MFTGLIEHVGFIEGWTKGSGAHRLRIRVGKWADSVQLGESIAVDGACLTVAEKTADTLSFDLLSETLERTTLKDKTQGAKVNLERAIRVGQPLGGHFITGHVDGVGVVRRIEMVQSDREIEIACSKEILRDVVQKGSVACDGISLTVVSVSDESFRVRLIPYTLAHTSWCDLQVGCRVNLETDILAKYVRRCLEQRGQQPQGESREELLKRTGFYDFS